MNLPKHLALAAAIVIAVSPAARAEVLTVLESSGKPPAAMLQTWLEQQAFAALDRRVEAYEKVKTPEQIATWQSERRDFFLKQLGEFPERTPLNAQTTGSMDRGDYRIEKVLFESEPNHHVTGLLYLPKTKPPYPGVIVPCGHSTNGKAADPYQRASILLAKHGIAAFCYDPIGQGERAQILNPAGERAVKSTTEEHTLVGIGSILLGTNTARHRIWDGMRALDYLASRPEVDPNRLGCTGNSGGGTLTCYLMALDDRIAVAAPSCYPTTFRELLKHGPQDAEQNIFGQIAFGMDIPDYVLMRAPKPTLINAATLDSTFKIEGAWDLFRQAKRLYTRMGFANRVELVEADAPHGFSTHLRTGSTRWMRRWLLKVDDEITEDEKTPILTDEEAFCSPKGQVMLLPGERSCFDLNSDLETKLATQRREIWKNKTEALAKVREVAGARRLAELPELKHRSVGVIQRAGYRIEKLVFTPEAGIELPALLFSPESPAGERVLYLHGEGKQIDAGAGGAIEQLVTQGRVVLAVDLRGVGETENRSKKWYGAAFGPAAGEYFLAYLLGKSLVGMWTEDALACGRFLANHQGTSGAVRVIGIGQAGIPALHAAALEPELFASVTLRRTLSSWAEVARATAARAELVTSVHGALKVYDLPDLVASLGAGKVTIESPAQP